MAFSASRLTLYALFHGVENDLRRQAVLHLAGQNTPETLLGVDLWQKCRDRFAKDTGLAEEQPDLEQLLVYADFADTYQLLNSHAKQLPETVRRTVREATPILQKLVPVRNRVMHFRPLNAEDLALTLDAADRLTQASDSFWLELRSTQIRLKNEPSFVLSLSIPTYEGDADRRRFNLPTPDSDETGFVGREQQVKDLIAICLGTYPVVSVVGEGGLGKTALALKVADEIAHLPECPFDAVVWTSSKRV